MKVHADSRVQPSRASAGAKDRLVNMVMELFEKKNRKNPEMKNSPFVFCIRFLDQDGANKEIGQGISEEQISIPIA